jgi:hypothetical protein
MIYVMEYLILFFRVVESTFRSLSNLNERLHQSFYYYLLSNTFRYVSIGQYLIPYFIVLGSMCAFAGSHIISYDINPLFVICFPRSFVFYIGGLVLFGLTFFKGIVSTQNIFFFTKILKF